MEKGKKDFSNGLIVFAEAQKNEGNFVDRKSNFFVEVKKKCVKFNPFYSFTPIQPVLRKNGLRRKLRALLTAEPF